MSESNGEKSKIIYFLLALLQAIILAWSFRVENAMGSMRENIATLQANYSNIMRELTDIKEMVKP